MKQYVKVVFIQNKTIFLYFGENNIYYNNICIQKLKKN